ncbi:peptidoglycan-binding protein [Hyalangium minutum]|uniref:Membrane-bound lytic murein transglycosylase D n=1 Tax=Hyalangium minutum TaxID=394096 RepID=A0A085WWN3_9BACT|nr:peptidoglycan-binding protein [Hyalangium minutum]KFE72096.1 Membrane-bound lytic murein transglycosylase D precursor [Hyalangium minutum]
MSSIHTISSGESLSSIARRYNSTVDAIAKANNIQNPNLIVTGRQLTIPDGFDAQPRPGSGPQAGDGFQAQPAQASAAAVQGAVPSPASGQYDGTRAAPGTTDTRAWIPANAPLQGSPSNRNAATYADVIDQFAVGNNPRYAPREGNTYCNIFAWDVTKAMGAEIPHWVDGAGNPTGVGQGRELDANGVNRWLNTHGPANGWRQVSAEEAQRLANSGHPTVASWNNPGGIGHIAVVRPGEANGNGPAIAQAGARNFNDGHVRDSFGNANVQYFVNDRGTATQSPSQPAPSQPAPSTPTPSQPAPSRGSRFPVPQSDLQRGNQGEGVRQLQSALVNMGYMTQAQMDTGPGTFGPQTEASLKRFQTDSGVPSTGYYGPMTREALTKRAAAPSFSVPQSDLQRGTQGEEVRQLQSALVNMGYMTQAQMDTGPGIFGPQTEASLKRFQADSGVPSTGYYGPMTREALTKRAGGGGSPAPTGPGPVTGPSTPAPTTGGVSMQQLRQIMPNLSEARAQQMLPHLNAAMAEAGINTPKRQAAFLAQLAHESGEFRYMEEIASGAAYEGRTDLGNTQPGDGVRFKGRGPIQLTGRSNYRAAGQALGIDLENNPTRAADPDVGFRTAAWFWNSRNLNSYADQGNFDAITYRVNGGYNGKASRDAYYQRALGVLGA